MRAHELAQVAAGLHITGRNNRRPCQQNGRKRGTIQIAKGAYLDIGILDKVPDPWKQREYVLLARILAAHALSGGQITFGHYTAMFLHGISMRFFKPDVWCRMERGYGNTLHFPEVSFQGEALLEEGRVRLLSSAQVSGPAQVGPVRASSFAQLLLEMAVADDFEAMTCTSSILSTFTLRQGIVRENRVHAGRRMKDDALRIIDDYPWKRRPRKAMRLIEEGSAQCESCAESALFSTLSKILPKDSQYRLSQQHEVGTEHGRFFMDFAVPELRIGFEVEGLTKNVLHGRSEQEAHQAFCERSFYITGRGWEVYPFAAKECLYQPRVVEEKVREILRERGRCDPRVKAYGGARFSVWK